MEAASPSKTLSGAGPARLHCGWDVPRRPRPAPPAVARPARAAALPRPGTRGDATPCADRPDRRPLALRAHAGAHGAREAVDLDDQHTASRRLEIGRAHV